MLDYSFLKPDIPDGKLSCVHSVGYSTAGAYMVSGRIPHPPPLLAFKSKGSFSTLPPTKFNTFGHPKTTHMFIDQYSRGLVSLFGTAYNLRDLWPKNFLGFITLFDLFNAFD